MAKCKDCGANQGCSCQLTNGRCPSCHSVYLQSNNPNVNPKTK